MVSGVADDLADWLADRLGHRPADVAPYQQALTHSSTGAADYQRLEFLGDRVLGLVVSEWLFMLFPDEPEGKLSRRANALVSGETCAEIARELGVPARLRLGKQARDDGAAQSDYVLGDAVEALIGALYLDMGLDAARAFIRHAWGDRATRHGAAPKHPKSALQELAAAKNWRVPVYAMTGRSGPHHAPVFTVTVTIPGRAEAQATGSSKQEAETAAAKALLDELS